MGVRNLLVTTSKNWIVCPQIDERNEIAEFWIQHYETVFSRTVGLLVTWASVCRCWCFRKHPVFDIQSKLNCIQDTALTLSFFCTKILCKHSLSPVVLQTDFFSSFFMTRCPIAKDIKKILFHRVWFTTLVFLRQRWLLLIMFSELVNRGWSRWSSV